MTITIRPEHERLIAEAIVSGRYQNPDDVIGRALEALRSEEAWLLENRNEIDEKIERALAQFEQSRANMDTESRMAT